MINYLMVLSEFNKSKVMDSLASILNDKMSCITLIINFKDAKEVLSLLKDEKFDWCNFEKSFVHTGIPISVFAYKENSEVVKVINEVIDYYRDNFHAFCIITKDNVILNKTTKEIYNELIEDEMIGVLWYDYIYNGIRVYEQPYDIRNVHQYAQMPSARVIKSRFAFIPENWVEIGNQCIIKHVPEVLWTTA